MTDVEILKIIEDNIKPCNSCYAKSVESTARRILEALKLESENKYFYSLKLKDSE